MKDTILAIAGRPGLFRLVARGNRNLIVESIDESRKRFAVGERDRVTSLNDVAMFTEEEDVQLLQVFQNLSNHYAGKPADLSHKSATEEELQTFMEKALPNYDHDRVRSSDMRKLLQWYNVLAANGITDFQGEEEAAGQ